MDDYPDEYFHAEIDADGGDDNEQDGGEHA